MIGKEDEFSHEDSKGEFFGLPCGKQAEVKQLEDRMIAGSDERGQPYDENQAFNLTPASAARRLKNLQNQAQALNMKLVPA